MTICASSASFTFFSFKSFILSETRGSDRLIAAMHQFDEIQTAITERNNSPLDDFSGISPQQMHHLLYDPLGDNSLVRVRDDIDGSTLDRLPLFRIAEEYLKLIQREKFIKLTPLGALPKKVLVELYEKKFLPDENIEFGITKLTREHDWISVMSARFALQNAGLVKKVNCRLSLTKNGGKLINAENRLQLFKVFLKAFTEEFNWGYNDFYTDQPVGQFGWAFSLFLLDKFGDRPRRIEFYAERVLTAFPDSISYFSATNYSTPRQRFLSCYALRMFVRFLMWFDFVTVKQQKKYLDSTGDEFEKSDLINSVFAFR